MNDIGLAKYTVKLVPHNPKWAELFEKEQRELLTHFPGVILEVSHGGSTAIPTIPAKPLLDIFAVVPTLGDAERIKDDLEALGYEYRGEEGVPERRFYAKGDRSRRTVNLHLVEKGSTEWKNHLLIKQYYLSHPATAQEYARLKESLAAQFPNDRRAYGQGKDSFIKQVIKEAKKELSLR